MANLKRIEFFKQFELARLHAELKTREFPLLSDHQDETRAHLGITQHMCVHTQRTSEWSVRVQFSRVQFGRVQFGKVHSRKIQSHKVQSGKIQSPFF